MLRASADCRRAAQRSVRFDERVGSHSVITCDTCFSNQFNYKCYTIPTEKKKTPTTNIERFSTIWLCSIICFQLPTLTTKLLWWPRSNDMRCYEFTCCTYSVPHIFSTSAAFFIASYSKKYLFWILFVVFRLCSFHLKPRCSSQQ